jgi:predicted GIY-YIG superfamily endonuclease
LPESAASSAQRYVGLTTDLKQRLAEHNAGESPHASKSCPLHLVARLTSGEVGKDVGNVRNNKPSLLERVVLIQ